MEVQMGIGSWEGQPQADSIAIAIPHVGLVTFEWAVSFKMIHPPVSFTLLSNRGLPIDRARCDLVKQAQDLNCTHIFFLDSDVIFPSDGLLRLYNYRLPIVAGLYGAKHETPAVWIEQAKVGQARYQSVPPEQLAQDILYTHPDIVTGMGCCLIDMNVFKSMEEPYFDWTQGRRQSGISEDFDFCEKARKAGIPIHIDTSIRCGHIDFSKIDWAGARGKMNL
jgi:hypothetical protein